MIRIILTICLFVIGANVYSQAPLIIRNDGKTTALDSNLFVGKSFRPPAFADTTQANQSIKVLDSSGRIIFTRDSSTLWVRNVGKYWQKLVSGSGVTTLQQAFNADPTANPDINAGSNTFLIAGDNNSGGVSRLIVGNNQGAQLYSKLDNISYLNAVADGTIEITSVSQGVNSQKLIMNESESYFVSGGNSGSDTSLTKLGVGTTYPEAILDVSGAPRFKTDSAQVGYVWTSTDDKGLGQWRAAGGGITPTLQQVTTAGDTTNNNIIFKGQWSPNRISLKITPNSYGYPLRLYRQDGVNSNDSLLISHNHFVKKNQTGGQNVFYFDNGGTANNSNTTLILPVTSIGGSMQRTLAISANNKFADSMGNISISEADSSIYLTTFRADTMRENIYTTINNIPIVDSNTYFTTFRADTMRENIYSNMVTNVVTASDSSFTVTKNGVNSTITIKGTTNAARMITTAYNKTGALITRGSVVYIDGAHSSVLPSIALAQANQESTSAYTYGLAQDDIPNMSSGIIVQSGTLGNLNLPTSTYTDGQTLYLSSTVPGGFTTVKQLAPNHYTALGTVIRAHPNQGVLNVFIRNGFQLDELSDVQIAPVPVDSALLQFSRVDSLWHDRTITQAIGPYLNAKANTAGPTFTDSLTINSTTGAFTLPRMTQTQMNAITPRVGAQVYNTTYDATCSYTNDFGWWSNDPMWLTSNGFTAMDEFLTYAGTNGANGNLFQISTGGGAVTNTTPIGNRPGILQLSTSTSATGRATAILDNNSVASFIVGGGKLIYETDVQIPTLSSSTETFRFFTGYSSLNGNPATNSIVFLYDSAGVSTGSAAVGRWQVLCSNASTRSYTTTDSTVTAGRWYRLRAEVNAAGNSVSFYINGTLVKTETNNIPTGALTYVSSIIKSNGTTARTAWVDFIRLRQKFTNPR